jgi:gamma-glutamylcysteine synthetase
MIRLAAFADEADKMVEGQIAALKRNGVEYIELRGLDGKNIAQISEEEAHKYA